MASEKASTHNHIRWIFLLFFFFQEEKWYSDLKKILEAVPLKKNENEARTWYVIIGELVERLTRFISQFFVLVHVENNNSVACYREIELIKN